MHVDIFRIKHFFFQLVVKSQGPKVKFITRKIRKWNQTHGNHFAFPPRFQRAGCIFLYTGYMEGSIIRQENYVSILSVGRLVISSSYNDV